MSDFAIEQLTHAKKVVNHNRMTVINKALHLQWLAGRVSAYSILGDEPGTLAKSRSIEDEINAMSDKLLGYDILGAKKG